MRRPTFLPLVPFVLMFAACSTDLPTSARQPDEGALSPQFDVTSAACDVGTYEKNGDCVAADPGHFVAEAAATEQTPCPVGTYQPDPGATECIPASPGHFVAASGAEAQTKCAAGRYQPNEGAAECITASPGYFVPVAGAAAQTACDPGYYQPNSGATSCMAADPGYFVSAAGATEQLPCAEGFTSAAGAEVCTPVNTAPSVGPITGLPTDPIALGTAVSLSAGFTDPDATDTHTSTIDWGDGTVVTQGAGSGTVTGSHTYAAAGIYTVEVTVHDGTDSASDTYAFVVVYDPDGGFVTGAGWVEVGAGSYLHALDAEGSARFGFVARYRRGQSQPDGDTQFHFRAGGMDFRSSSYQWLVVAGARAQFKGEGTINGAAGYCFMLTAIDGHVNGGGDVDRLRLKVSTCGVNEIIVFDNLQGAADDAEPTAISRGNIVIHR